MLGNMAGTCKVLAIVIIKKTLSFAEGLVLIAGELSNQELDELIAFNRLAEYPF